MIVMLKRQQSMRLTGDGYPARGNAKLIFNNDRLSTPLQVHYCAESLAASPSFTWAVG